MASSTVLEILNDKAGLKTFGPLFALNCDGIIETGDLGFSLPSWFRRTRPAPLRFSAARSSSITELIVSLKRSRTRGWAIVSPMRMATHSRRENWESLASPREERPIAGQERPVDSQDNERPNQSHRINYQGAVGNRRKRIGAGNEGKGAGNQDRGPERDVFALLPVRALFESLGARSRDSQKKMCLIEWNMRRKRLSVSY